MPPRQRRGAVETAVVEQIAQAPHADERPGLAAAARVLARKLDTDAGLATAAVARELRATLAELTRDDEGGAEDGVAELLRRLSSPVRDPS